MSKQSLANQLGWAITTKDNLNSLSATMKNFSMHYAEQVNMLASKDYFAETLEEIRQMSREFEAETNDIIKHIELEHLAYIDKQSKAIRQVLSQYQN
jgi:hypothetical protein